MLADFFNNIRRYRTFRARQCHALEARIARVSALGGNRLRSPFARGDGELPLLKAIMPGLVDPEVLITVFSTGGENFWRTRKRAVQHNVPHFREILWEILTLNNPGNLGLLRLNA
jgi:hypothetical protein